METLPTTVETTQKPPRQLARIGMAAIPALFAETGPKGAERFIEFFTAAIRNKNTRMAYARAVLQFADWCERKGLTLPNLRPVVIAAYIEELGLTKSKPTVKQHLAAIRMLFDYLVTGQVIPTNPAHSVHGPKHVVKKGKTPVLTEEEASQLLDAIDYLRDAKGRLTTVPRPEGSLKLTDMRDAALIAVMLNGFARVSAALDMNVEDFYRQEGSWWFRLHEKGGKRLEVPANRNAEWYLERYLTRAGWMQDGQLVAAKKTPLFQSVDRQGNLTGQRLSRKKAFAIVRRRARAAGIATKVGCHTWRGTGITNFILLGGSLETAQRIAGHASPRTTKLYDRTEDTISVTEVERIRIGHPPRKAGAEPEEEAPSPEGQ